MNIIFNRFQSVPRREGVRRKIFPTLDERCIYRLKSREPVPIDVWLITASNRNLMQEVKARQFRNDLYYRLHV